MKELPSNSSGTSEEQDREQKILEDEKEFRAVIIFKMDDREKPIQYTLYTNPVFISLPPCVPGPKESHEVHLRELARYQKIIWTVENLSDHQDYDEEDEDGVGGDEVLVINTTGKGAELLARAWCSERGKNAITRRQGGPCYVCARCVASKAGLGIEVLIWVS